MLAYIPLVGVNLATVVLESVFYGIFLVLASTSIFFHVSRARTTQQSQSRNWKALLDPIFIGSIVISLAVTGHWITTVMRLFDAFANYNDGNTALEYYASVWFSTETAQTSFLVCTLIMCDSMLIYRLWIVWNYNYVIVILPTCAVLGLCISGPVAVHKQTLVRGSIFAPALTHWVNACYSFTFVTNIYSSCGIAYRVWLARQRVSAIRVGGPNLMDVLVTMVESATLYASYTIFFLGTYEAKSNLQFFTIDTLCPIAGIAFMLINVRVGLGWAQRASAQTPSTGVTFGRGGNSYTMRPLAIDVTTAIHRDMGDEVEQSQMKTDYGVDTL
ncbi:hypothetical protein FOMPIDRAFT_1031154 [Fomitopsis schrenkii]|uniref:Uncharacterized protein n=1 Tax=Fomitopsis schrenkii TaxID=2126942 RepID=S8E627_FOMSC|nr:hypothetical protein FOMPIDRAFT_1031154 [Fomitopsis schrenkii]